MGLHIWDEVEGGGEPFSKLRNVGNFSDFWYKGIFPTGGNFGKAAGARKARLWRLNCPNECRQTF